jgi:xylulokinase
VYLGIDLGTSGVKAVLVGDDQAILDQETAPLAVQRPQPLWSEQDPEDWWTATRDAVGALAARRRGGLDGVRAIGLSGQMHGATLFDARDRVLRPAILWNDGRSEAQCRALEERAPALREITGNLAMPGFTAPKLLWVQEHEPEIARQVARVLLPKDALRLRLVGVRATDVSDASGTLWLDVGRRAWSGEMLEATGLEPDAMPELYEGPESTGTLAKPWAEEWGMTGPVPVAAGAGDQAGGAIGAGVTRPGDASLSLGTSGVIFSAGTAFAPSPESGVHAFCHALPKRWHQMSVTLSAASCLSWVTALTSVGSEARLLAEIEARGLEDSGDVLFLPYLSGERTPHNDPHARGVFFGLNHDTGRADLGRAVIEGVGFALADGQAALVEAGAEIDRLLAIGGGARSRFWGRILASILDRPLAYATDAEVGPAFGAARLARLCVSGESPEAVCTLPPIEETLEPEPGLRERYQERIVRWRRLYTELRELFPHRGDEA